MKISKTVRNNKVYNNDKEYQFTYNIYLNPEDNGGEAVSLLIDVFCRKNNYEDFWYSHTSLETTCYGSSSSKIFVGANLGIEKLIELGNWAKTLNMHYDNIAENKDHNSGVLSEV